MHFGACVQYVALLVLGSGFWRWLGFSIFVSIEYIASIGPLAQLLHCVYTLTPYSIS